MAAAKGRGKVARPRFDAPVRLRPCTPADIPFLVELYASTRADELALMPWSAEDKAAFVRMQFEAQDQDYRTRFPDADRSLVLVGDEPVGRLYVDRRPDEILGLDISLLPEWRGRGLGAALVGNLLDEAARTGRPFRANVQLGNPARRLYVRLGMSSVSNSEFYELMEYRP
jgi:GNAT superfamily N-acetyltransferase